MSAYRSPVDGHTRRPLAASVLVCVKGCVRIGVCKGRDFVCPTTRATLHASDRALSAMPCRCLAPCVVNQSTVQLDSEGLTGDWRQNLAAMRHFR